MMPTFNPLRWLQSAPGVRRPNLNRYRSLADDYEQRQLLHCCAACVGPSFSNCNTVNYEAVKSLMMARHHHSKPKTRKLVKRLVRAGILEHVFAHNVPALRLTVQASEKLRTWRRAKLKAKTAA